MSAQLKILQAVQHAEKLAELRGILKFLKAAKQTTTYVPVAMALGMFSGSAALAGMLGEIQVEDSTMGAPFLSSLVVSSVTGIPGKGYFDHARKLGCSIGKSPNDELEFWLNQLQTLGVPAQGTMLSCSCST